MKPIPNWPNYFADEQGNIYSSKRGQRKEAIIVPRKLMPSLDGYGLRRKVTLYIKDKAVTRNIAPLILQTFLGPRPKDHYACHGPIGTHDDSLHNLSWQTQKQNMRDKVRDGTEQQGEKIGTHKLNQLQVRIIRRYYEFDHSYGAQVYLGRVFNVDKSTIEHIVHRRNWAWLKQSSTGKKFSDGPQKVASD